MSHTETDITTDDPTEDQGTELLPKTRNKIVRCCRLLASGDLQPTDIEPSHRVNGVTFRDGDVVLRSIPAKDGRVPITVVIRDPDSTPGPGPSGAPPPPNKRGRWTAVPTATRVIVNSSTASQVRTTPAPPLPQSIPAAAKASRDVQLAKMPPPLGSRTPLSSEVLESVEQVKTSIPVLLDFASISVLRASKEKQHLSSAGFPDRGVVNHLRVYTLFVPGTLSGSSAPSKRPTSAAAEASEAIPNICVRGLGFRGAIEVLRFCTLLASGTSSGSSAPSTLSTFGTRNPFQERISQAPHLHPLHEIGGRFQLQTVRLLTHPLCRRLEPLLRHQLCCGRLQLQPVRFSGSESGGFFSVAGVSRQSFCIECLSLAVAALDREIDGPVDSCIVLIPLQASLGYRFASSASQRLIHCVAG